MDKRWVIKVTEEEKVQSLQQELKIHPVICNLLVQRGITTYQEAKQFVAPKYHGQIDKIIEEERKHFEVLSEVKKNYQNK